MQLDEPLTPESKLNSTDNRCSLLESSYMEIRLQPNRWLRLCGSLRNLQSNFFFQSFEQQMKLKFKSPTWTWGDQLPTGNGINFRLQALSVNDWAQSVIHLSKNNDTSSVITSNNFLLQHPSPMRNRMFLRAPIEHQIELKVYGRMSFVPFSPFNSSWVATNHVQVRIIDSFADVSVRPAIPKVWIMRMMDSNDLLHSLPIIQVVRSTFHVLTVEADAGSSPFAIHYTLINGEHLTFK